MSGMREAIEGKEGHIDVGHRANFSGKEINFGIVVRIAVESLIGVIQIAGKSKINNAFCRKQLVVDLNKALTLGRFDFFLDLSSV